MPKGEVRNPGKAPRVMQRAKNAASLQGKRIDAATRELNEGAAKRDAEAAARKARIKAVSRSMPAARNAAPVKAMRKAPVGKGGR